MATRRPPKSAGPATPEPPATIGAVELYRSIERLQADLANFLAGANTWRLEIEALHKQIESMRRDRQQAREVLVAMLATVTEAGAAPTVINALTVAIRALE